MLSNNRLTRHRLINLVIVVTFSMLLTHLFYPISDVGFYPWLIKSLQVMGGMLVFTFYGLVEGYFGQAILIILFGLGIPILLFTVHVLKKSIAALYAATFFWVMAGWMSVIAAPM